MVVDMDEVNEQVISEIKQNIELLKNRLLQCQDFKVTVTYWVQSPDNAVVRKCETVGLDRWIEVQNELMRTGLTSLAAENGTAYAYAHQRSIGDLENLMDKLVLSITQLEIAFGVKPKAMQKVMESIDPTMRSQPEVGDVWMDLDDLTKGRLADDVPGDVPPPAEPAAVPDDDDDDEEVPDQGEEV